MKNLLPLLFTPLLMIGGCSSSDNSATSEKASETTQTTSPRKISKDNVFSTQINALDTAKMVGTAAQKSVDRNQQKLEEAKDQ